jgi:hypothetical protein
LISGTTSNLDGFCLAFQQVPLYQFKGFLWRQPAQLAVTAALVNRDARVVDRSDELADGPLRDIPKQVQDGDFQCGDLHILWYPTRFCTGLGNSNDQFVQITRIFTAEPRDEASHHWPAQPADVRVANRNTGRSVSGTYPAKEVVSISQQLDVFHNDRRIEQFSPQDGLFERSIERGIP